MYEKIVIVAFKHMLFLIKTILYLFWYLILGSRLKGWIIIVQIQVQIQSLKGLDFGWQ